ncbi:hypothetical protein SUGI_0885970 [Cryptomeria japonica]|nr:hypothetical protein SUGI_0885970 [Cryptomeria japonica]
MSLQWMKRKPKGFEGKKENGKVNDRIQKLICDLKSKRESLAAVQTGFPSAVASFVTNTWMPSDHGGEKKKRRWSSLKKKGTFNAKCPSDEVRGSGDFQSEICTEPHIVGQFSANLQSGSGISKQIYMDPQSGRLFSAHPQSEGGILKQFSATEGSSGRFGNDPQFLGQYGNDPETGGEFGNVPGQSVSDSRFVRQCGNDPQCREQSDGGIESMSQFDRDPLPLQLGHEQNCEDQIVEEVSAAGDRSPFIPISESHANLCLFHKEFLVAVLLLAVSLSVVLDVKKAAVGVTAIVYFVVRVLFRKQETEPKIHFFSARTCSVTNWPSICKWGINSLCRATDLLICRNVCKSDAFTSNCGVIVPRSNFAKDGCGGIQCSKLFSTDVNKKPRQRRALVQKSCLGRGSSGDCSLEIGAKGLKYRSALGSSMLIVVLVGLLAGRFPAFVLALAWCLVVKLVQIAEQGKNIPSFHKGKKQLS